MGEHVEGLSGVQKAYGRRTAGLWQASRDGQLIKIPGTGLDGVG